jgi:hypothetical protein
MFGALTVREWDRFTSMIESAGVKCSGMAQRDFAAAYQDVADDLTQLQGELVQSWQAEFYAAHGHEYRFWGDRADDADDGDQGDGADPGAFPVMGADWPAGAPVIGRASHLHPRCTCTHPATAPCDLSCPVHRGHGSAR